MKKMIILLLMSMFLFASCEHNDEFDNTPKDNFEALWRIIDEGYCFFEYKNIDWDEVHTRYSSRIKSDMTDENLFDILSEMLAELKDGHVNLTSDFNTSRYWKWFEDYPDNFDEKIQRNYIGTDYGYVGGMIYKILPDNVGYVYYGSFMNLVSDDQWAEILRRMRQCDGLIFDIRNNGGGSVSMVKTLAESFADRETLCGYVQYKNGKGRNDFSEMQEYKIDTAETRLQYHKKVALLTNRSCFSAANMFTCFMHTMPNVTIIGDRTGGGSGLPFSSELPNGWGVRFSSNPFYDASRQQIEFGIAPDIQVDMTDEDMAQGKDSIIERAIKFIKSGT